MLDFQYLGTQGSEDGEFLRPNGIDVDVNDNIVVSDTRNYRIQVRTSYACLGHYYALNFFKLCKFLKN